MRIVLRSLLVAAVSIAVTAPSVTSARAGDVLDPVRYAVATSGPTLANAPQPVVVLDTANVPEGGSRVCEVSGTPPRFNENDPGSGYWYGEGQASCTDDIVAIDLHVNIYCYDNPDDRTGVQCPGAELYDNDPNETKDAHGTSYYRPVDNQTWARTHVAAVFTFDRPAPDLGSWCKEFETNDHKIACYYRSDAVPLRDLDALPF